MIWIKKKKKFKNHEQQQTNKKYLFQSTIKKIKK